jgi:hypothetical protein
MPEFARIVLKRRGINKWLTVRRLLIQVKARWKAKVRAAHAWLTECRALRRGVPVVEGQQLSGDAYVAGKGWYTSYRRAWTRGYLAALEECRAQVRALLNMPRDVDFPDAASKWPAEAMLPATFPDNPQQNYFRRLHNGEEQKDTTAATKEASA